MVACDRTKKWIKVNVYTRECKCIFGPVDEKKGYSKEKCYGVKVLLQNEDRDSITT